jgi:hypothetical protein
MIENRMTLMTTKNNSLPNPILSLNSSMILGWVLAALVACSLFFTVSSACAHGGSLNSEALAVCSGRERSQACQYEDHHNNLYIGTCQYVSEDDLICVRNKPIKKSALTQEISELSHEEVESEDPPAVGLD